MTAVGSCRDDAPGHHTLQSRPAGGPSQSNPRWLQHTWAAQRGVRGCTIAAQPTRQEASPTPGCPEALTCTGPLSPESSATSRRSSVSSISWLLLSMPATPAQNSQILTLQVLRVTAQFAVIWGTPSGPAHAGSHRPHLPSGLRRQRRPATDWRRGHSAARASGLAAAPTCCCPLPQPRPQSRSAGSSSLERGMLGRAGKLYEPYIGTSAAPPQ